MERYVLDININQGEGTAESAVSKSIAKPNGSNSPASNKQFKGVAEKTALAGLGQQIFSYQASIVNVRQGNTDAQQKSDFVLSTVAKGVGIWGAFKINPILGFVAMGASAFNFVKNISTYNYEKQWETIGLAQERLRAGASYNRSRGGRGAY